MNIFTLLKLMMRFYWLWLYNNTICKRFKDEIVKIDVQYIADQAGRISKFIVVSDNSQTGFQTFYLKGQVE